MLREEWLIMKESLKMRKLSSFVYDDGCKDVKKVNLFKFFILFYY